MSETTRVSALATWLGQQLKALKVRRQVKADSLTALLALGANVDRTITWDTAFPDANYSVFVQRYGTDGLSSADLVVKSQTATQVVINVKAGVALAAGWSYRVTGIWTP